MEKINRFKVLFALWAILLGYCAFINTNVHFIVIAVFFGYCALVLGFAYVLDNMNEKEKRFFNKIVKTF